MPPSVFAAMVSGVPLEGVQGVRGAECSREFEVVYLWVVHAADKETTHQEPAIQQSYRQPRRSRVNVKVP